MNIQSLYPASSPPLLGFPEDNPLNTILKNLKSFGFEILENLLKLSSTSGNSSKFFVSSIAVTLTGKAAGRSLIIKREIVIVADVGEGVDGLPDVLPVDCVEPGQLFHLVHSRDPECFEVFFRSI